MTDRTGQVEIATTDNGRVVIAATVEQAAVYLGLCPKTICHRKYQLSRRRTS